jgi:hypothetical protein
MKRSTGFSSEGRLLADFPTQDKCHNCSLLCVVAGIATALTIESLNHYSALFKATDVKQRPNGVNQVPAITGSVIRVKPHDGEPAGRVGSLIAVKAS